MSTEVYTKEVVADMVARYNAVRDEAYAARTAVVQEIADELEVEKASVVGKLVSERVYRSKEAAKKEKGSSRTKADFVAALQAVTGIADLSSFENTKKDQLEAVFKFIVTASDEFNAAHGLQVPGDEVVTS